MPRVNHKNLLFFEKQRNITVNGVRIKSTEADTPTNAPSTPPSMDDK